ncbi:hypothetical protein JCM8547_000505 [Rhodosporidiobolus lusitaniae]
MSTRTIAVIGATGHQGGGVVTALLSSSSSSFTVRALTRDPKSASAQSLTGRHAEAVADGRLQLVQADLDDEKSLVEALKGVSGVFAAFSDSLDQAAYGKRLVNAVKAVGNPHFVYSTLPSITKLSSGKLSDGYVYDPKAEVAEYTRKQLTTFTFVVAGVFYSNLADELYARRNAEGVVEFRLPIKPSTVQHWVDDCHDIGVYTAAIFNAPPSLVNGKTYPVASAPLTMAEIAVEYEEATGEKAVAVERSQDEALADYMDSIPKDWSLGYGLFSPANDPAWEDLGVKASTIGDFVRRSGFRVQ